MVLNEPADVHMIDFRVAVNIFSTKKKQSRPIKKKHIFSFYHSQRASLRKRNVLSDNSSRKHSKPAQNDLLKL